MNVAEQIALAWGSLIQTLHMVRRPALWAPWLVLGGLEAGVLAALAGFAHPWLSPVMAPVIEGIAGEHALHYPDLFSELPLLYARFDLLLVALPGAVVLGAATTLMADAFRGRPLRAGAALGLALRRAPALILVNLPFNVLAFVFSWGIGTLAASHGGLIARAAYLLALAGSVLIQSLFLYMTAVVMIEHRGPLDALRQLPRTWRNGFAAAVVLGTLLLLPLLPLNLLSGASGLIAARGIPELVTGMLLLQLCVALAAAFLLTAATTLVFMTTVARMPRGEAR